MSSTSIISMRMGKCSSVFFFSSVHIWSWRKNEFGEGFFERHDTRLHPMVPCISKKWCQAAIGCAGCDFNLSLRAGSTQEPFFNAALSFFRRQKSSQEPQPQPACGHLCLFPACILALKWWCSAECTRWRGHMSWATVLFPCAFHRSI